MRVLIVGGGPSGLLLAHALVSQAVESGAPWSVTLADAAPAPTLHHGAPQPRDDPPLLVTRLGASALGTALCDDIAAAGVVLGGLTEHALPQTDTAAKQSAGAQVGAAMLRGCVCVSRGALRALMLARLEALLRTPSPSEGSARADAPPPPPRPAVWRPMWQWRVSLIDLDASKVVLRRSTPAQPAAAAPEQCEASFDLLVGADGAGSIVRGSLLSRPGFNYKQEWCVR